MEPDTTQPNAASHMKTVAVLMVLVCAGAIAWRVFATLESSTPLSATRPADATTSSPTQPIDPTDYLALLEQQVNGTTTDATSSDPVGEVGIRALGAVIYNDAVLKQQGKLTPDKQQKVADTVVKQLQPNVPYQVFTTSDVKTKTDTSYKAMMQYRTDLQGALKPLLANKQPEMELFGLYAESKDTKYLTQLRAAADNYALAASNTIKVMTPQDAALYQVNIVNAMRQFAAVLNAFIDHADDPVTTGMLTTSYTQAESDMYTSFNALAAYFKSKTP